MESVEAQTGPPVGAGIRAGECYAEVVRTWVRPSDRALYVGLSGGIGSGKTTVASIWKDLGAQVIAADDLAREVVAPGSAGLAEIAERFGSDMLTVGGALDRIKMGELAFASEENRRELESITHPRIARRAAELRDQAGRSDVVVYDVPLLVENSMADQFDCVVMVHSPKHMRFSRLEERGVAKDVAQRRMAVQATRASRLQVSNVWVHNGGTRHEMSEVASRVFTAWLKETK